MVTRTKKPREKNLAAKAEAEAIKTAVKVKTRLRRDQLPGNFIRSKSGAPAYVVTTNLRDRKTNEPMVRLRFASGNLSSGEFTIAQLEKDGAKFLTERPSDFPAAMASQTDPRQKAKAKARRDAAKADAPATPAKSPKAAKPAKTPKAEKPAAKKATMPEVGTVLRASYKKQEFKATVVEDGVRWNGKVYKSLSAAGCAITGRPTCNGWAFFRLKETPKKAAKPTREHPKATAAKATRVKAGRISKKK